VQALGGYIEYLEHDVAPRARASFRLGRERFEQKLRLDEGITLDADRLLAIAMRELRATQDEFKRAAQRLDGGDPVEAWRRAKLEHPQTGELAEAAGRQLEDLTTFIDRHAVISRPDSGLVNVAPTPEFYRWSFASMWAPGPFETKPTPAYYYLTDADPSWPAERQEEHLRHFNYPTSGPSRSTRSIPATSFTTSTSGRSSRSAQIDHVLACIFRGRWAHYCEQMMIEAGFRRQDELLKLGQLAEALIRLARFIVSIRLHVEDMSVRAGHAGVPRRGVHGRGKRAP